MINFSEIIVGGIGLLTTVTSAWISWFLARKKYNTEVDRNYLENLEKGLETYDSIILHNRSEMEYLMKENQELRKEISELRKQVLNLTMNICMNFTCARRIREHQIVSEGKDGKSKSRLNETEDSSRG